MQHFKTNLLGFMLTAAVCLTGCSWWHSKEAKETGRTENEYAADHTITRNVANALDTSPVYKYPDVKVTTLKGSVQLSGFVHNDDQKRNAAEIAQRIPGVHEVINNLVVKPEAFAPTGRTNGVNEAAPQVTPYQNQTPR